MRKDKNTGIVRTMDSLGRVVIPKELRDILGIDIGAPLEYFADDENERILLRTYRTMECMFCSTVNNLSYFKEFFICESCLKQVSAAENMLPEETVSKPKLITFEEVSATTELGINLKEARSKKTIQLLIQVMQNHPNASQKKWAELIGVSQGRVSQLVKILNESNSESAPDNP